MSFRKRNVGVTGAPRTASGIASSQSKQALSGVRPSAIDGRPTTSTGTSSLDGLLAGHAGLALGSSLLVEENGTTDYAGALLRFYAAEGLVQGQCVHVIGLPEQWGRELPGLVGASEKQEDKKESSSEKMKIAWRYERLGQFGSEAGTRDRPVAGASTSASSEHNVAELPFCHTFDLTKRLVHPSSAQLNFLMLDPNPSRSPFDAVIAKLSSSIAAATSNIAHRVIVPSLLSPALYPPHASMPQYVLKFQHNIRSLLAKYSDRMTVMQTLPLLLYPRTSGLVRWLELLCDGVIELAPFPHSADAEFQAPRDPTTRDELPQGMLKVHRIPIFHDRGSGTVSIDTDRTFTLSRRKFTIKPFNLPPIDGDTDAQQAGTGQGEKKSKPADLEF